MPARLILNADDFGLTRGINRAIAELHSAGAISSATLMASGAAFDDAIAVARAHPSLDVGCHIVLTDGAPVSPPSSIRSLIGADGKNFRPSLVDFVQALLFGRINEEEVAREVLAQIEKLQRAGIRPSKSACTKSTSDRRKLIPSAPIRLRIEPGGETGAPSVSTMWQPTPSVGWAQASWTASSKAGPAAISVAEGSTQAECSSAMARLMPRVRPKSSALRMRRAGMAWVIVEGSGSARRGWMHRGVWLRRFGLRLCAAGYEL